MLTFTTWLDDGGFSGESIGFAIHNVADRERRTESIFQSDGETVPGTRTADRYQSHLMFVKAGRKSKFNN